MSTAVATASPASVRVTHAGPGPGVGLGPRRREGENRRGPGRASASARTAPASTFTFTFTLALALVASAVPAAARVTAGPAERGGARAATAVARHDAGLAHRSATATARLDHALSSGAVATTGLELLEAMEVGPHHDRLLSAVLEKVGDHRGRLDDDALFEMLLVGAHDFRATGNGEWEEAVRRELDVGPAGVRAQASGLGATITGDLLCLLAPSASPHAAPGRSPRARDLPPVEQALAGAVRRLVAEGRASPEIGRALLDQLTAEADTPEELAADMRERFEGRGFVGLEAVAARATLRVGESSAFYWHARWAAAPEAPAGDPSPPRASTSWEEGASADAVGAAVGTFVGGYAGGVGGTIAAGATGGAAWPAIIAGVKIGAAVGGVVGGAVTSAWAMLDEGDEPEDAGGDSGSGDEESSAASVGGPPRGELRGELEQVASLPPAPRSTREDPS